MSYSGNVILQIVWVEGISRGAFSWSLSARINDHLPKICVSPFSDLFQSLVEPSQTKYLTDFFQLEQQILTFVAKILSKRKNLPQLGQNLALNAIFSSQILFPGSRINFPGNGKAKNPKFPGNSRPGNSREQTLPTGNFRISYSKLNLGKIVTQYSKLMDISSRLKVPELLSTISHCKLPKKILEYNYLKKAVNHKEAYQVYFKMNISYLRMATVQDLSYWPQSVTVNDYHGYFRE